MTSSSGPPAAKVKKTFREWVVNTYLRATVIDSNEQSRTAWSDKVKFTKFLVLLIPMAAVAVITVRAQDSQRNQVIDRLAEVLPTKSAQRIRNGFF